jgi:hypothetical protein
LLKIEIYSLKSELFVRKIFQVSEISAYCWEVLVKKVFLRHSGKFMHKCKDLGVNSRIAQIAFLRKTFETVSPCSSG